MNTRDNRDYRQMAIENRSRRAAERQGLTLEKSRRRDPRSLGYGKWFLRDRAGTLLTGDAETGATLEQVERYLAGERGES
jgi:hypothetical protein